MKRVARIAMAVALCAAVALPASAQFDGKEGKDFGLWMTAGVEKKLSNAPVSVLTVALALANFRY